MAKVAKPANESSAVAPNKGKKLLIIILALLLLVMLGIGGIVYMNKLNHAADNGDDEYAEETVKPKKPRKKESLAPPAFINLEPFTVNLVPETGDQYLQVVLSLELDDPAAELAVKALMPRIRNDITLLLSSRKASELMSKEGKEQLAQALKDAINLAVEPPRGKKTGPITGPVDAVLFTSFIIQ